MTTISDMAAKLPDSAVSTDTQPFVFAGSDGWGGRVRGSIVAFDAADAFALLLRRGIDAQSVAAAGAPEPYRIEFASRESLTVGELVRQLVSHRRTLAVSGYKN